MHWLDGTGSMLVTGNPAGNDDSDDEGSFKGEDAPEGDSDDDSDDSDSDDSDDDDEEGSDDDDDDEEGGAKKKRKAEDDADGVEEENDGEGKKKKKKKKGFVEEDFEAIDSSNIIGRQGQEKSRSCVWPRHFRQQAAAPCHKLIQQLILISQEDERNQRRR